MKTCDIHKSSCDCQGKCDGRCQCGRGAFSRPAKPVKGGSSGSQNQQTVAGAARESAIAQRVSQMPKSARAGYLKTTRGKASPRAAIKAFCLECIGFERAEIAKCTGWGCPLWMYRPWKKEQKTRPAAGAVAQESKTVNLVSNMEIQNDE